MMLKIFLLAVLTVFHRAANAATIQITWYTDVGDIGDTQINVGDTVEWVWADSTSHTVTNTPPQLIWDSGAILGFGKKFSRTFDTVGTFHYHCGFHPTTMQGNIVVASSGNSQPATTTADLLAKALSEPQVISSGSAGPTAWSATLHVREHRHINDMVSFNTRAYCYNDVCSYPGPTIEMHPGDTLTLTLVNELDTDADNLALNELHSPNTTNIHTHGLHIDPKVDTIFNTAAPGESLVYVYELPVDHAPGLHWYHGHRHGSSSLQMMGGLVGALEVIPYSTTVGGGTVQNVPASITDADENLIVLTQVQFSQPYVGNSVVTQGCGADWTCDRDSQAPLCTGEEDSSPYEPFRVYSYPELSAAIGSTMDIDPVFTNLARQDFILANGQYLPTVTMTTASAKILRTLHASGGDVVSLTLSGDATGICSMTVLAWDGVYLDARESLSTVNLVAASRVDLELTCTTAGVYTLLGNGEDIVTLLVQDGTPTKPSVTDAELAAIVRPWYLSDLTGTDVVVDNTYSVTVAGAQSDSSVCGFSLGTGSDCSDVNAASCNLEQFSGERGTGPSAYHSKGKLVTFTNAVNEWTLYGFEGAVHPMHIHVNHYQIVSYQANGNHPENYFKVGQWRDTIPAVADQTVFRFRAADFPGETVMHCHFQRHEDLGMMDTFLVTDVDTYNGITSLPTAPPTNNPDIFDPIIVESAHPYPINSVERWTVEVPGATCYTVNMDPQSWTANKYDYVNIKYLMPDGSKHTLGNKRLYRTRLSEFQEVSVETHKLIIKLKSDSTHQSAYGFKMIVTPCASR